MRVSVPFQQALGPRATTNPKPSPTQPQNPPEK
jgi:hypothetical protein